MKNKTFLVRGLSLFIFLAGIVIGMSLIFRGMAIDKNFMEIVLGYLFLFIGLISFIIFNMDLMSEENENKG